MRKLLRGDRDQQTGVRRGALEALTWTQIVQAVSNVWNEPWEELLSARGTGARQTALFIGRIRGRLSLKKLGQLAGGIHHNAVGIVIRRFTQRLQSDRTLLEKVSLVQKGTRASLTAAPLLFYRKPRASLPIRRMRKSAFIVPNASNRLFAGQNTIFFVVCIDATPCAAPRP